MKNNVILTVYFDGERKPDIKEETTIEKSVKAWLPEHTQHMARIHLYKGLVEEFFNNRTGIRVIIKPLNGKRKHGNGNTRYKFMKTKLEGACSIPVIKVAAMNSLKSEAGYHRTVCLVEANGLTYKVKCKHKGLSWGESVDRCVIVSKS